MRVQRDRRRIIVYRSRDTEIQNLWLSGLIHQDVARLEVPMNHAALVRVLNGIANLANQRESFAHTEFKRVGIVSQRLALHELHGEIRLVSKRGISRARLINLCNARVVKPPQNLRLVLKPLERFAGGVTWPKGLEGNSSPRARLLSLVHHAHAALADQANDAIVAGQHPNGGNRGGRVSGGRVSRIALLGGVGGGFF